MTGEEARRGRRAASAIAGIGLGLGAGLITGMALERLLMRVLLGAEDEEEDFNSQHSKGVLVGADDGVQLHVEIDTPEDFRVGVDPTIVFSHGYTLNLDSWYYQRRDLQGLARLVFWDQRSHGRSQRAPDSTHTIDQLGRDLASVVQAVAPTGPVVLVGHSMGGMTTMALADQHPQWFGERVRAVGLIATSSGGLDSVSFGLPGRVAPAVRTRTPVVMDKLVARQERVDKRRAVPADLGLLVTRVSSFGSPVPTSLASFVNDIIAATPLDVVASFLPTLMAHDKVAALAALRGVPVLIMVGHRDLLTPLAHSRRMAQELPDAQLEILPATGHLIMMERHELVNARLRDLVARARSASARA